MAEICVIYGSEDEEIVGNLVALLGQQWDVWWGEDIPYGDWEDAARNEIATANVVLALLSHFSETNRCFSAPVIA